MDDEGELGLFTIAIVSSLVNEKSDLYFATSAVFLAFLIVSVI